jgi:hypothetical protein
MTLTKRWIIAVPDPATAPLAASLGVPLPIAQVLANRGFHSPLSVYPSNWLTHCKNAGGNGKFACSSVPVMSV